MMTEKKRATTAHGDVTYETVECDSCETEVMKTEARRFVVGNLKKTKHRSYRSEKQLHFEDSDYTVGWVCPYCFEEDIVGFPSRSTVWNWFCGLDEGVKVLFIAFALGSILTVLFTVVGALL
jgi:hypothetical protein